MAAFILTEDSGDDSVIEHIPAELRPGLLLLVNNPKLGQVASIDLAYSKVKTPYIFHCEDDWFFYRQGFIEDSKAVLESDSSILQVWLRSFFHDIREKQHYTLGAREVAGTTAYYHLQSSHPVWKGFSWNPGLRRLSDYQLLPEFASLSQDPTINVEDKASRFYYEKNYSAAILENDAVAHLGDDRRIYHNRKNKKLRKKIKGVVMFLMVFSLGFFSGINL